MRMKRIQMIMNAIRIHRELTHKKKDKKTALGESFSNKWAKKVAVKKTQMLRGRIAASRKRTRDLWLGRTKQA